MTFLKHGLTRWLVSLSVGFFFFLFLTNNCTALLAISTATGVLMARSLAVSLEGLALRQQGGRGEEEEGQRIRSIFSSQEAKESRGLQSC